MSQEYGRHRSPDTESQNLEVSRIKKSISEKIGSILRLLSGILLVFIGLLNSVRVLSQNKENLSIDEIFICVLFIIITIIGFNFAYTFMSKK
jgi:hypothetical protein